MTGTWRSLRLRLAVLGFLAIYVPVLLLFVVFLMTEQETTEVTDGVRIVAETSWRPSAWVGTSVTVAVTETADHVAVVVTDHGSGIPPRDQEHVFERFWSGRRDVTAPASACPSPRSPRPGLTATAASSGSCCAVDDRHGDGRRDDRRRGDGRCRSRAPGDGGQKGGGSSAWRGTGAGSVIGPTCSGGLT